MHVIHHKQRGISMIEVLVAALILSFGIVSIGTMMLSTLQNSRSVMLRARAVELAQDMAERIHNNALGRSAYPTTTPADKGCFQVGTTPATACSPEDLAAHDLWHWHQLLASPNSGLPAATVSITASTSAPPIYTITVRWQDGSEPTSTTPEGAAFTDTYVLEMML